MTRISQRASALIIVLLMVSLVAIVAVSFLTSMRVERTVAFTHQHHVQAGFYEQFARSSALARLEHAHALAHGKVWATQPGAFYVYDTEWERIDLHSGEAGGNTADESVNLNRPNPEEPTALAIASAGSFSGTSSEMRVRWIYCNKDGSLSDTPTADSVGRLAFWIDDESTRVNINTAWKADNTSANRPDASPSQVDLPTLGLTPDQADAVKDIRETEAYFNTVEEINASAGNSAFADTQRFNLTHYNHSPALNPFGEAKLILTTQKARANGSSHYLRILQGDPDAYTDPGLYENLDGALVQQAVNSIAGYLRRTDWPYPDMAGQSIAAKYAPISPVQIAVDILEYVRASESETPVVDPIRGNLNAAGDFVYNPTYNGANAIMGTNRSFRTTEVAIWVAPTKTNTIDGRDYYVVKVKREVHLPEHYGIAEVDLRNYYYAFAFITSTISNKQPGFTTESGNYLLQAGGYEVIVEEARVSADTGQNSRAAVVAAIRGPRLSISRNTASAAAGRRLDVIPESVVSGMNYIDYVIQPDTVPEASIYSRSVFDPSANNTKAEWVQTTPNTLGSANSNAAAPTPYGPQQDQDGGALSKFSQRFPAPGRGGIRSIAELGNVHTGIVTHDNTLQGVPFRTLRLQPRSSNSTLPDWLLLDLFTAPQETPVNPLVDLTAGEGGKVNLNAVVAPFPDGSNDLLRVLPLRAAAVARFPSPNTVVSNLLAKTPASNAAYLGAVDDPYFSTGQISEVLGISDSGESSEANLVGLVDRVATRGGVFSIYTVGQSIRRTPSGKVEVLSERRDRTVVEFDSSTNPAPWKVIFSEKL